MTEYFDFLASKRVVPPATPIAASTIGSHLFPFQRAIVEWALDRGRAAIFADCGLGKTAMQLEWSRHVPGRVLILAPLAVAPQTIAEGLRFGVGVKYALDQADAGDAKIVITNYERFHHFDMAHFDGVVLDESSILKAFMGKTKRALVERCSSVRYRLACTATPAPNDHLELGNHAEFLGVMTSHEMIARWFLPDTAAFGVYRLKGHGIVPFWDWVASWAVCIARPSDMGYSDVGYVLPELTLTPHVVDVDLLAGRGDSLFRIPELNATSVHDEKRRSLGARATKVAELVAAEPDEQWLIWCETDYEADALKAVMPFAVEVRGSHSQEHKERASMWFAGRYVEDCRCRTTRSATIYGSTTAPTARSGSSPERSATSATPYDATPTPKTQRSARRSSRRSPTGSDAIRTSDSPSASGPTASRSTSIDGCSSDSMDAAQSADAIATSTALASSDSISTTAIAPSESEGCSVPPATSASGSSATTRSDSSEPPCTCGRLTARRRKVLITKSTIFGLGLNFQNCARQAFVGATFSYELFYQAVRRSYRFGQKRPVGVHVAMATTEAAVWSILSAKRDGHDEMRVQMSAAMRRARATASPTSKYAPTRVMEVPAWLCTAA